MLWLDMFGKLDSFLNGAMTEVLEFEMKRSLKIYHMWT